MEKQAFPPGGITRPAARGFAAMDRERVRAIAAKGGRATPPEKRAYNDRDLAARAGRKGGRGRQSVASVAEVAGEALAVLLCMVAFWALMFLVPWDEAMASASAPSEPEAIFAELAFGAGVLLFALAIVVAGVGSFWRLRAAASRRRIWEAAVRSHQQEERPYGDATLLGREP